MSDSPELFEHGAAGLAAGNDHDGDGDDAAGSLSQQQQFRCAVCRGRVEPPVVFLDCLHSACLRHTTTSSSATSTHAATAAAADGASSANGGSANGNGNSNGATAGSPGGHNSTSNNNGNSSNSRRRHPLSCTICQALTPCLPVDRPWVRDVMTEHLLERESRAHESAICENCNVEPPQFYCNTCTSGLCQPCVTAVHSAPIFRRHVLVSFGEHQARQQSNWDCQAHGKPVEFFDQEKQRPACVACLLEGGGLMQPHRSKGANNNGGFVIQQQQLEGGKKRTTLTLLHGDDDQQQQQQQQLPAITLIPEKYVPVHEALKRANEDLSVVLQQGQRVIEDLRRGYKDLQDLTPMLAHNFQLLGQRIEATFTAMRSDLDTQHADANVKTAQVYELKDKMLKNRQQQLHTRLVILETIGGLVNKLLSLRDADAVVLTLKEFFVHQYTDAVNALIGSGSKHTPPQALLKQQNVDLSAALNLPSIQLDWSEVPSPLITLQSGIAELSTRLRSSLQSSKAVRHELATHRQTVHQLRAEVRTLKETYISTTSEVMEWSKAQLQLLLRHQGARLFPRRHAKAALQALDSQQQTDQENSTSATDDDCVPAMSLLPGDLEAWSELRHDQADAIASLKAASESLEELQYQVQEFNRDITVRRCRPSPQAVSKAAEGIKTLMGQIGQNRNAFDALGKRGRPCWAAVRSQVFLEEVEYENNDRLLKELDSDGSNLASGVEQLQELYDILSKRLQVDNGDTANNTDMYLNDIKGVKPDSDKRLQAVMTAELEKERRKKLNQMEDGLRDGIKHLRPTSGLKKVTSEEALGSLLPTGGSIIVTVTGTTDQMLPPAPPITMLHRASSLERGNNQNNNGGSSSSSSNSSNSFPSGMMMTFRSPSAGGFGPMSSLSTSPTPSSSPGVSQRKISPSSSSASLAVILGSPANNGTKLAKSASLRGNPARRSLNFEAGAPQE